MRARLCSQNPHKLAELRASLPGWQLELLEADGYPPEEAATYEGNARGKARFGRGLAPPAEWVLGEDSGIEVDVLGGAPGVHSARWADDGKARLLEELREWDDRRARLVCTIVAVAPDGREFVARGVLEGRIADEARGSGGFGYDPVFVPDGEARTVAELRPEWKARHSHRARAAAALAELTRGR